MVWKIILLCSLIHLPANGQTIGKFIEYYSSGEKIIIGEYRNDSAEIVRYFESNSSHLRTPIFEKKVTRELENHRVGIWKYFHENAQLKALGRYSNSIEYIPVTKLKNNNLNLDIQNTIKNFDTIYVKNDSLKDGYWEYFDKNGRLEKRESWLNGILVNETYSNFFSNDVDTFFLNYDGITKYDSIVSLSYESNLKTIEVDSNCLYDEFNEWIGFKSQEECINKYNTLEYKSILEDTFLVKTSKIVVLHKIGIWKYFHPNNQLHSLGRYGNFVVKLNSAYSIDSLLPSIYFPKNKTSSSSSSFNSGYCFTDVKDGFWEYFDQTSQLIKRELWQNGVLVLTEE